MLLIRLSLGLLERLLDGLLPARKQRDLAAGIAPGQGAVIDRRGKKIAVFRNVEGSVIALDARCPHRGCIVEFNEAERRWDCPCHLATFDLDGSILESRGLVFAPLPQLGGYRPR